MEWREITPQPDKMKRCFRPPGCPTPDTPPICYRELPWKPKGRRHPHRDTGDPGSGIDDQKFSGTWCCRCHSRTSSRSSRPGRRGLILAVAEADDRGEWHGSDVVAGPLDGQRQHLAAQAKAHRWFGEAVASAHGVTDTLRRVLMPAPRLLPTPPGATAHDPRSAGGCRSSGIEPFPSRAPSCARTRTQYMEAFAMTAEPALAGRSGPAKGSPVRIC